MSVARFIADQRAKYRVPHTITCLLLGISVSWFYKWIARADTADGLHTDTDRRRAQLDVAVASAFEAARGLHGSPRLVADLRDLGWEVSARVDQARQDRTEVRGPAQTGRHCGRAEP